MHITPEQLAVGRENFWAAIGSDAEGPGGMPSRRSYLTKRIDEQVETGRLPGHIYFGYEETLAEPLRVGVIGTGDEGSVLIGAINPDFVQVKSISDLRPYNIHRAFHGDHYSATARAVRPGLIDKYGWTGEDEARENVNVYGPWEDLIAAAKEDDLEAVIIALPLHLHAPAAIAAMNAGLHVLTEKLMGHSVRECKEMARVAKSTGKHLATGHQRHYNILYQNAVDLIRRGTLGDLHYIRAQWHRGNLPGTDSWQQPMPRSVKPSDPQAGRLESELASWERRLQRAESELEAAEKKLAAAKGRPNSDEARNAEIKKWTGQQKKWQKERDKWSPLVAQKRAQVEDETIAKLVKEYGYTDRQTKDEQGRVVYDRPAIEELIRWRLWNRTGGGLMAELGSHQLDAASIFIAAMHEQHKQYPLSVAAAANRPIFPPDRDVDDHVYCLFEFPAEGFKAEDPNEALKRIGVQYASINGNGYGGYGETVFGTDGTLQLLRETEAALWKTSAVDSKTKVVFSRGEGRPVLLLDEDGDPESAAIGRMATKLADRGYQQQIEHWAWCVRENPDASEDGPRPKCHPKVALGDAVIALTTNMAAREGRRVDFKPEWFDPESDALPENDLLGTDLKPDPARYKG